MAILDKIPQDLLRLKNPPKMLYYKGNTDLLQMPKIAVVGSRKISFYTKNLISNLCLSLKKYGICVVSGGAIGCDITAHKAAFPNTIAVFANGLNIIYPKTNSNLINQMYESSLVLSEYEPDEPPFKHRFLQRNRIVVGLCEAIVIAQADLNSGSLSSAKIAKNLGIPIFAFPQRIDESKGTNLLLKQKDATLLDDFDELGKKFGSNLQENLQKDEVLDFIKNNSNLTECLNKFGSKIYEYELLGKISINGFSVSVK
ncbi:DNA-processing protein DprA [Campylobacter sputorum]|uniref:DNA-processing protein DprA n=1 Tax=Campylobacter sputorum TaxID=206 RepID=UPI00053BFD9C|nr:DNA-processing protein DprA [Campylobacter sputorum]